MFAGMTTKEANKEASPSSSTVAGSSEQPTAPSSSFSFMSQQTLGDSDDNKGDVDGVDVKVDGKEPP